MKPSEYEAIANRPLDDDLNVLVNRCEEKEPLSLAEQRELWEWLQSRVVTLGDQDAEIQRLRAIVGKLADKLETYSAKSAEEEVRLATAQAAKEKT